MPNNVIELVIKATDNASVHIQEIAAQFGELTKAGDTLQNILGGIFAGFTVDKLVESITEAETATNDLNRAFDSFGASVGVSKEDMLDFADSASKATTFTEGSLKKAQAVLLQYTQVAGQSFEEARDIVVDLAARMGTDAPQAAELLGRALQNPINGMRLLAQAGVTLTSQQRTVIEQLVAEGDAANVMAFELDQLRAHTKGAADDLANTLGGALTQLKNSFAHAFEGQGADVEGLTHSIKELTELLNDKDTQSSLSTYASAFVTLGKWAAEAAASVADATKALAEFAAHQVNGPDSHEQAIKDQIKGLQEDSLIPGIPADQVRDDLTHIAELQKALDSLEQHASDAAKAAQQDAELQPIKITASKIPILDTPIGEASSGRQPIDIDALLYTNPDVAAKLISKFVADTETDLDKAAAELNRHVEERAVLVNAHIITQAQADDQNVLDAQKFRNQQDDALKEVQVTAQKMEVPLDDIQKQGQQVAASLTSSFESFFESGDLSGRNFANTMIKFFEQILAKAASIDLVNALGLNKLFNASSASGASGSLGGLLGAFFGAFTGGGATDAASEGPPLPGHAGGGLVDGPTWVGEGGPEVFVPGTSGGQIYNQRELASIGGGRGGNISISQPVNIKITGNADDKALNRAVIAMHQQMANNNKAMMKLLQRNGYTVRI